MRHTVTDGVAWSVSRSLCYSCEPCKNGWSSGDAIWWRTQVGPRNQVL